MHFLKQPTKFILLHVNFVFHILDPDCKISTTCLNQNLLTCRLIANIDYSGNKIEALWQDKIFTPRHMQGACIPFNYCLKHWPVPKSMKQSNITQFKIMIMTTVSY